MAQIYTHINQAPIRHAYFTHTTINQQTNVCMVWNNLPKFSKSRPTSNGIINHPLFMFLLHPDMAMPNEWVHNDNSLLIMKSTKCGPSRSCTPMVFWCILHVRLSTKPAGTIEQKGVAQLLQIEEVRLNSSRRCGFSRSPHAQEASIFLSRVNNFLQQLRRSGVSRVCGRKVAATWT